MGKSKEKILIIDDDADVLFTARMILRPHYAEILTEKSPKQLESVLNRESPSLVILDMNFAAGATTGNEGMFWLRKIKEIKPDQPVIMNTAYGDIELAVECMKEGAFDFLIKPWQKEKLLATVRNVLEIASSRKKIRQLDETRRVISGDLARKKGRLIGDSMAMQQVLNQISKVAATDANVLILGENGTGKELVAREIHHQSRRAPESFVPVDLGAIPSTLFESELFGHVKGAFTDARESKAGRFEVADKGSLFLDEIGNISLEGQAKLLSALQNRQVYRLGSSVPVDVDIRLISATNKPLYEMIREQTFREDLVYRINTVEIHLPPLRERIDDIPLLAEHFLERFNSKYEKGISLAGEAVDRMMRYTWPGNIRELQHTIERAVIMADSDSIREQDLFLKETGQSPAPDSLHRDDLEKAAILKALDLHEGNLSKASKELGIGRTTLYRKISKYGIDT